MTVAAERTRPMIVRAERPSGTRRPLGTRRTALDRWRETSGSTWVQLAVAAGVDYRWLLRLVAGAPMGWNCARRISAVTGISVAELVAHGREVEP